MSTVTFAFLIGVIAGLRALTPLAVVSWVRGPWLHQENVWLSFLGAPIMPVILGVLALGELINDKLPKTPSRKAPLAFAARILTGAVSGAALGARSQSSTVGLVLGALGAVVGTLGGYEARRRLVKAIGGKDLPIALLEDVVAVGGAFWIASQF